MNWPAAASTPARTAPPLPWFGFSRTTRAPAASATAAVASALPSSTTRISHPYACEPRKSRQPASVAGKRRASLYAGITIDTLAAAPGDDQDSATFSGDDRDSPTCSVDAEGSGAALNDTREKYHAPAWRSRRAVLTRRSPRVSPPS